MLHHLSKFPRRSFPGNKLLLLLLLSPKTNTMSHPSRLDFSLLMRILRASAKEAVAVSPTENKCYHCTFFGHQII